MTREVWIPAVALGIGVALLLGRRLGKVRAVGRVVDHETYDDTGTTYHTAVIEYEGADGARRRAKDDVSLGAPLPLGTTLPVLVDRRDPTRVSVMRNALGPVPDWVVFVVIPAIALAVGWLRQR